MRNKKAAALILAAILGFSACSAGKEGISVRDIDLKEKNFKSLGRTYFDDGKIFCALSGTGVEFTFTGKSCSVTVEGDPNAANPSTADSQVRIAVYLNGERVVDDMIDNASETYEIECAGENAQSDIKIVKLSESPMSTFAITNITVNGTEVKPAEDKEMLIEFVGDSITCGYGVDDEDANHHFSTRTEDCTKAYAIKTAELLNADYSLVSFSGYGIISGYSDGSRKVSEQTVPPLYCKYGYCRTDNNGFKPSEIDWGFKKKPDAVVINLGTNDDSYCKNIAERCEEYKTEYINFLKTVRENNPDSKIFCVLGIMGQNLYRYVEQAVEEYKTETGDENVFSMMFDNQNQALDGIAADWHPTERTHDKAAAKLAEFIQEH